MKPPVICILEVEGKLNGRFVVRRGATQWVNRGHGGDILSRTKLSPRRAIQCDAFRWEQLLRRGRLGQL